MNVFQLVGAMSTIALCRGCLATEVPMRNMYELNIHDQFSAITNIKMVRWEGLPEQLCAECEDSLLAGHRFRLQCQKSDVILRDKMLLSSKPLPPKTVLEIPGDNNNQQRKEGSIKSFMNGNKLTYIITLENVDTELTLFCPYGCTPGYAQRNHLVRHLVKKHGVNQSTFALDLHFHCMYVKCPYASDSGKNKHFSEKKTLKKHILTVHESEDIACHKCNVNFANQLMFERHKASCEMKFVCASCDTEYKTNERLLVHLLRKHPDLHKEYKRQRKESKELAKIDSKRKAEETTNAKRYKSLIENQSTQTSDVIVGTQIDFSPKRMSKAFKTVKNDISLNSCVSLSPQPLKHSVPQQTEQFSDAFLATSSTIETQTMFEDILSIRSQNSEDEIFESVSLSDIQTQTWPVEFSKKMTSETQTNPVLSRESDSPDLSFKETQTCFCLLDSPKPSASHFHFPRYIFDSATTSPTNNLTSTETQTAEAIASKDVLLSFNSIETQTCEDILDTAKLNI